MLHLRRIIRALLAVIILSSSTLFVGEVKAAAAVEVWTATSYENVFLDASKPLNASSSIRLTAARNEFEAAQIIVKNQSASQFIINNVTFTNLTSGTDTIAASHLNYQFVETIHLNHNSGLGEPLKNPIRKAPDWFPDRLTNAASIHVNPTISQPVWIRAYIPKTVAAGIYNGTATVQTTVGSFDVPISIDVQNVTIPDAKDSTFSTALWQTTQGPISWLDSDPAYNDLIYYYSQQRPGFSAYSPDFWTVMESFAQFMKDYRNNVLSVNMVNLLLDGGSSLNTSTGVYTFNWSKFDEYIQFFVDRDAVKRLEGLFLAQTSSTYGNRYQPQIIDKNAANQNVRVFVLPDSAKANAWINQFIPALKQHLDAKGWTDMWYMHVGDEANNPQLINDYKYLSNKVKGLWPTLKLGDAIYHQPSAEALAGYSNIVVPLTETYDLNTAYYKARQAAGDEVWIYNCVVPKGLYLNRALDGPVWSNRATIWNAFKSGVTGYLHWGYNGWHFLSDEQDLKGDGFIVYPDPANLKLAPSIRYEALRDGLEDYELLKIVQASNPALAEGIVNSLVTNHSNYSRDSAYMLRIREILVRAAAGLSFSTDLAAGKAATASTQTTGNEADKAVDSNATTKWQTSAVGSQWITVDLGAQHQVDAVKLKWGSPYATSYKVQTSYTGTSWGDAATVTNGNGGDDFIGINAKARYVRISTLASNGSSYALHQLEVGGFVLPRVNLAGGKAYQISVPPSATYPDTNYESTNGVLGARYDDGRTWGNKLDGGTHYQKVTIDLGSVQLVDNIKFKGYDNYESNYGPEYVDFFVSTDGVNFTQLGVLFTPNASGNVYQYAFPATPARYIRTAAFKTYSPTTDWLFIDEIEAYGPAGMPTTNLAAGKAYTKSLAPDAAHPDTNNAESTNGILAGAYGDGQSYGYPLASGQSKSTDIVIDLGANKTLNLVRVLAYNGSMHNYKPDTVSVSISSDNVTYTQKAIISTPTGNWFNAAFADTSARYVKVTAAKTYGSFADWMFLDEIEIHGY